MNAYIVTVIVIGLYLAAVLLVFVTGRLITRTKLYRRWAEKRGMQYPRSRIIEDLQPVQETMSEFINASTPSRELLQRLAGTDEPIRVRKLLASVPASESSWTALSLIAVAGLVSFGREGVALTEVGGEILARMSGDATKVDHDVLDREAHVADKRLSFTHGKNGSDTVSHLQLVKEALEKNEGARFSGPVRPVRGFELGQLRTNSASLPGNNSPPTPKVQNT